MADIARVFRRWRLAWAVHAALAGMLAVGLMLYGVYSGWSARAGAAAQLSAPVLHIPGDMAVLAPEWSATVATPSFDLSALMRDPWIQASASSMVPAIRNPALGPQGALTIWGVDPAPELQEALPLVNGHWPAGPGEVIWPHNGLPGMPQPGQEITLRLPVDLSGDMVEWHVTVVGTYRPDDLVRGPIVGRSDLASHLGRQAANTIFLWQRPSVGTALQTSVGKYSVLTLNKAVVTRPTLTPILQSTREPSLPMSPGAGPHTGASLTLQGDLLPFGMLVSDQVLDSSTPTALLTADAMGRRLVLFPAVLMLMLLLLVSVTTVTVALTLERSEELGVYKTTGVGAKVVQRQATLEMLATVLLGTGLGVAGLWLLVRYGNAAVHLELPWMSLAEVWGPVAVVLGWWAGRAAGIMYSTADTRSLLNQTARFDGWALLRFDLTKPRG